MRIEIGRSIRNFVIFVAVLVVMMPGVLALTPADPPEPSYITASSEVINVDGNSAADPNGEWDLFGPLSYSFFGHMYKSGNPDKEVLSELYLRYDCKTGTLYAMVLLKTGHIIDESNLDNHHIKVLRNGKTNWEVPVYPELDDFILSSDGNNKIGWESSLYLPAGLHIINVHTQVDDDETSAILKHKDYGIPILIECSDIPIPEFPTIALPVAAILGLMFIFGRKRE